MGKKVLIIDDDVKLCGLIEEYIQKFGFDVVSALHPDEGIKTALIENPDIIILDVMMPDKDGFEVLKILRKEINTPVIMLTARGEVTDRIVGLELGADDYLPKPFEPRELIARIQVILRRSIKSNFGGVIKSDNLIIEVEKQSAKLNNKSLDLTTMEFELLLLFVKHPEKVFTRDDLMERLKGFEWECFDRSVDVLLSRLRQKLGDDPKKPSYIKTIWGKGYKYIGECN